MNKLYIKVVLLASYSITFNVLCLKTLLTSKKNEKAAMAQGGRRRRRWHPMWSNKTLVSSNHTCAASRSVPSVKRLPPFLIKQSNSHFGTGWEMCLWHPEFSLTRSVWASLPHPIRSPALEEELSSSVPVAGSLDHLASQGCHGVLPNSWRHGELSYPLRLNRNKEEMLCHLFCRHCKLSDWRRLKLRRHGGGTLSYLEVADGVSSIVLFCSLAIATAISRIISRRASISSQDCLVSSCVAPCSEEGSPYPEP